MRVTSHCANHPSKEASQRCRSCRKWLCEVCFRRYRGRVYCDRKCEVSGAIRDGFENSLAFARQPLHAAWVIAAVAGASALLLTAVGTKVAELVEVSRSIEGSRPASVDRVEISADIVVSEDGLHIESSGPPGTQVLLLRDGRPLGVVTLDDDGHASTENLDVSPGEGPLRIVPLTSEGLELALPTPTEIPTPAATPEPSPTATPRPTPASRTDSRMVPTPLVAPPVLQLVQDAGPRIAITFSSNRPVRMAAIIARCW